MRFSILAAFYLLVFASCKQPQKGNDQSMVIRTDRPKYATGFEIQHLSDSSTKVVIFNPDKSGEVLQSIIWKPGAAEKVVCLSTTHLSFLDRLKSIHAVKGCGFTELVKNVNGVEAIRNGQIQNISKGYETNDEVVFSIMPDLFFVYPFGDDDPRRFLEKGIGCVQIAEYAEKHPLGRTEWIKVFGVFMQKESLADSVFQRVEDEYIFLMKEMNGRALSKPKVFFGSYDAGNWFAPPSNSYAAQFIRDAGGEYLFEGDTSSSNIIIPSESFIARSNEIDFWGKLLTSNQLVDISDFTMNDNRFSHVKAISSGGLFYCNTNESDYHGDALMEPHLMLADLIGIFHPGQEKLGETHYFKTLK